MTTETRERDCHGELGLPADYDLKKSASELKTALKRIHHPRSSACGVGDMNEAKLETIA